MKKLFLTLIYLSITIVLFAQDSEPSFELPRAAIKISPLQFALNTLELGVEVFNPTYSKSFSISAGFRSGADAYNDGSGGSVEIAYRKYVSPMKYRDRGNSQAYQGIYYSLFVRGEYFKGENDDYYYGTGDTFTEKTLAITPGFTIGLQRTLWKVLLLDVYVGGGVKFSDVENQTSPPTDYEPYYGIFDPGYSGILPKIGVKIGIGL